MTVATPTTLPHPAPALPKDVSAPRTCRHPLLAHSSLRSPLRQPPPAARQAAALGLAPWRGPAGTALGAEASERLPQSNCTTGRFGKAPKHQPWPNAEGSKALPLSELRMATLGAEANASLPQGNNSQQHTHAPGAEGLALPRRTWASLLGAEATSGLPQHHTTLGAEASASLPQNNNTQQRTTAPGAEGKALPRSMRRERVGEEATSGHPQPQTTDHRRSSTAKQVAPNGRRFLQ